MELNKGYHYFLESILSLMSILQVGGGPSVWEFLCIYGHWVVYLLYTATCMQDCWTLWKLLECHGPSDWNAYLSKICFEKFCHLSYLGRRDGVVNVPH